MCFSSIGVLCIVNNIDEINNVAPKNDYDIVCVEGKI
jgi:hypothetical protein